ncbi:uncharacterized protein TNCV_1476251 [Trichonephila clavipes]|nr:uncharacterized protein TNCV_1476251 [Trichonephila clavipes]
MRLRVRSSPFALVNSIPNSGELTGSVSAGGLLIRNLLGSKSALILGLSTGFDARASEFTHTEYVLVKSVGPKVLWAESGVQGIGEYFPPLQFHVLIVKVEIGGVAIYRLFGEFRRANSYCHLYGAQGQRQNVLLAPCPDYVRQVALATTTKH